MQSSSAEFCLRVAGKHPSICWKLSVEGNHRTRSIEIHRRRRSVAVVVICTLCVRGGWWPVVNHWRWSWMNGAKWNREKSNWVNCKKADESWRELKGAEESRIGTEWRGIERTGREWRANSLASTLSGRIDLLRSGSCREMRERSEGMENLNSKFRRAINEIQLNSAQLNSANSNSSNDSTNSNDRILISNVAMNNLAR